MKSHHTDRVYAGKLSLINDRLRAMAHRVEAMIADAMLALTDRDEALARKVMADDLEINRMEIDTDELCLRTLARWQPMASDLRFLTLAMKMVTDLERIGDLAVNIAERAIDLSREPPLGEYVELPRMAQITREMLRDAIECFVDRDAVKASRVIERDDEVDALYVKIFQELLNMMRADPANIHRGIHVQSVAKWIERIGDHATNLAEEIIFMVEGQDVRHPWARRMGEEE